MRKNIFFPILLFLSISILLFFSLIAGATEVTPPTTAEVANEVARFTGLSSDLTQLILEAEPELLGKFNKTVFGVQVLNQLLTAKDTEAMKSIFNLAVSNLADYLMKQAVHPAVITFFGVVKAYKTSLEVVRDYIIIPKFDNDIYARYKKARGGVLDYSYANPTDAFEEATFAPFGGYYLLKEKRYKELIKAKGYNPELIGDKLEASLRRKIDDFWMKRMEAKYTQDRLKESQKALIKSIWGTAQSEIDLLKKLALELGTIHAGLFITSKDLPEGWWVVKDKYSKEKPSRIKDSDTWNQKFEISDAKGYKWDTNKDLYFRMVGQEKSFELVPHGTVTVWVDPRFTEILVGEFKGELYDWGKDKIQTLIDYQGHQPVGSLGAACIGRTEYSIEMVFYRGIYSCNVRINDFCIDKADMPKYEKLVRYFSRIIAEKMPAIVIEKP